VVPEPTIGSRISEPGGSGFICEKAISGAMRAGNVALVVKAVLDLPVPAPEGVKGFRGTLETGDGVDGLLDDFTCGFLGDVAVHSQGKSSTREARDLLGHGGNA